MSMATLERAVLAAAKIIFHNSKLKLKDIQEWSSANIKPHDGEVIAWCPDPGVFVAIKTEHDKRPLTT